MDWATVTSTAITGAVGIAGVVGGVITARIAGSSARKSVQLNITAEADRARLADKRRIYARGVSALDTAMQAEKHAQSVEASGAATAVVEDQHASAVEFRAKANDTLRSASEAVSELQLMVESLDTAELAKDALDNVSHPDVYASRRNKLLATLRDDLGKEARRAYQLT